MNIPEHIAVVMDGNGRWAKRWNLPRTLGHKKGINRIEELIDNAKGMGVKIVTLFAFSTENWSRPKKEIERLFFYLKTFILKKSKKLNKDGVRVNFIGRRDRLGKSLLNMMEELEDLTKNNRAFIINIALDYGGRWDILHGAKRLARDALDKKINLEDIEEKDFSRYLFLNGMPYPDLLIRTSGELRISNFLLWQLAYAEFYFPACFWPDFDREELKKAIKYYSQKERRFGKIDSRKPETGNLKMKV